MLSTPGPATAHFVDGEVASLCEYWPLSLGNQWAVTYIDDGGFIFEVTDEFFVNGFVVWEITFERGNFAGSIIVTTYNTFVDGFLYETSDLSDLDSLPNVTGGMTQLYPEEVEVGVPFSLLLHSYFTEITVTAFRGSTSDIIDNLDFPPGPPGDGYWLGDMPDVLAFVDGDDLVTYILGRDVGPVLFIDYINEGIVSGGCSIPSAEEAPMSIEGLEGGTVSMTIPGTVLLEGPIQWFKDGVPLSDDVRISGSNARTLTISHVLAIDSGSYTANYNNAAKSEAVFGPVSLTVAARGSSSGGTCFIATAAYGTPLAEEIYTLRAVRDSYMLNNAFGTAFVDSYYRSSPPIADFIAQYPALRLLVRVILTPIVLLSKLALASPLGGGLVMLAAGLTVMRLYRRCWMARARSQSASS